MKNYFYFRPEDFDRGVNHTLTIGIGNDGKYISLSNVLTIANEKLNKLIESSPVVYDGNSGLSLCSSGTWSVVKHDENDHKAISSNFINSKRKARLMFIEEIVKEPCSHSPKFTASHKGMLLENTCEKCGATIPW
jgi:hypothetical protein